MAHLVCHFCGSPVVVSEPIGRDTTCEQCQRDLRCCRNCRHWNDRLHNQCTETMADPVADKERRNFCEYFYYSREPFSGTPGGKVDRAAEARRKLEELFRKPPGHGMA